LAANTQAGMSKPIHPSARFHVDIFNNSLANRDG